MDIDKCKRCLLPSSLEGVSFDEQGVCSYCRKYEHDFGNWDEINDRKAADFHKLMAKAKSLKRSYDCLVPLSGGKDSTYALYLATKVYNL